MIKRITAALLALLMCFAVVGCSRDGAPDGMHLVSAEGEPFKLYVPEVWQSNASSGISGAFLSATDNIAVSARYFTPESSEQTLEEYVDECVESYAAALELFELGENGASVLGGEDARLIIYTATFDDVEFRFRQYFVKYNGDFITLTFRAPDEKYEEYADQYQMIADAFVLCEKGETVNDCVTDKKTPEGMKIASSDVVEYRFYVPTSWICDSESGRSEAYYPESGKPNVTVTSYSPDEVMTAEEYFAECEKQYEDTIASYELLSEEERTVAERDARVYTYRAVYGEKEIRVMQTVLVYNRMVYSITYTALAESFDEHAGEVEAMLDAFRFR